MNNENPNVRSILLVENDLTFSLLLRDVIEGFGYVVEYAPSAPAAEAIVPSGEPVDLLIADIELKAGCDGFELARRLRSLRPGIHILYISGDARRTAAEMGDVNAPILQKPVPLDELKNAISEALSE